MPLHRFGTRSRQHREQQAERQLLLLEAARARDWTDLEQFFHTQRLRVNTKWESGVRRVLAAKSEARRDAGGMDVQLRGNGFGGATSWHGHEFLEQED